MIRNKQNNEVIPPNSAHQAVVKLPQALFSGDWKREPSSAFRTAWAGIQMTWTRCKKVDRNKMPRALHQDSGEERSSSVGGIRKAFLAKVMSEASLVGW